jgi:hypothetical protein
VLGEHHNTERAKANVRRTSDKSCFTEIHGLRNYFDVARAGNALNLDRFANKFLQLEEPAGDHTSEISVLSFAVSTVR